ncbi:MAG: ExbD/TolR family protein [Sulfuriferula sp.]
MRNHRTHYFGNEEKARIEIIPMIDIMMFLLVFFMLVTLKMIQSNGMKLELPQSSTATPLKSTKVTLNVNREGEIFIDAAPITETALGERLKKLQTDKKVDVIIAGDKGVVYQRIVRAMDIVRDAGISSVALATSE